jgi:hypothetical protein
VWDEEGITEVDDESAASRDFRISRPVRGVCMSGGPEGQQYRHAGVGERRGDEAEHRDSSLALIACEGCSRSFNTLDGPGMIAVIKGSCPDCGGTFALVAVRPDMDPDR